MAEQNNQTNQHGADINIVAPSDAYALNAPYANYGEAYTVLAHGPTKKGEMFLYSRADCTDGSCTKVSPHDMASIIKKDANYHEGQDVALFSCNAGKWGGASYAQALSNELGAKVIAPNGNVIGLLAVGTGADKGSDQFNGWIVAESIKEVDPTKTQPYGLSNLMKGETVYSSPYNREIIAPNGEKKYLKIEDEGKFEEFNPQRESVKDSRTKNQTFDLHGSDHSVQFNDVIKLAQHISTMPEHQQQVYQQRLAEVLNNKGVMVEQVNQKSNEIA